MADNLPAPRPEQGVKKDERSPQPASSSRRESSGNKVAGDSGGCLLPISLLSGLALLLASSAAWIW